MLMELSAHSRLSSYPSSSSLLKSKARIKISHRNPNISYCRRFLQSTNCVRQMESRSLISCFANAEENGYTVTCSSFGSGRIGEVKRVTKETSVSVKIDLDGSGISSK